MSIFKNNRELKDRIVQLEKENQELLNDKRSMEKIISKLKEENALLSKANKQFKAECKLSAN